jgi:hypothetical protein
MSRYYRFIFTILASLSISGLLGAFGSGQTATSAPTQIVNPTAEATSVMEQVPVTEDTPRQPPLHQIHRQRRQVHQRT